MNTKRPKAIATKQVENEKAIITEWRFPAGAETGWHRHNYDYIVVPGMDGDLLLVSQSEERVSTLKAGQSYYKSCGVEHNVINVNEFEFYFIEIELK